MRKVILAAINAKYIHSNPAVYSLQKAAQRYGTCDDIQIREFTINQNLETIYYQLLAEKPDVVAFSVYIWNVEMVKSLCRDLKKVRPQLAIWLGGPEVSFGIAGKGFEDASYDYVMEGEGERLFYALLQKGDVPAEWGITFSGKSVRGNAIEDLAELPFIYDDLAPFENRIIYYEASRGCPFHCAYCLSAAEKGVRELSLQRVLAELAYLEKQGVPQIKFVDRTFNCHPSRAAAILQWILALPDTSKTNFHFEIEADLLADSLVDLMVQMPAGRIQLEIGIQSTNPATLKACGRTDRLERVFGNVKKLLAGGNINIHVDLIAGLPLEDYQRFGKSFNDVYRLGSHQFQLGFLKLLTGAPMNELAEQYGYVFSDHTPYEIISNDSLSPQELLRLKCIEDVLERLYNSGRFSRFLALLEKNYASPFAMMEDISRIFWDKGLTFTAMGLAEVSDVLAEYFPGEALHKALLLDYYAATPSDKLPAKLKTLAQPITDKSRATALLKKVGRRDRKIVIRPVGEEMAAVDYTQRDPVTGQYKILEKL